MSIHMLCLVCLILLTVGVFQVTHAPDRRHWRKKMLRIMAGVWLAGASVLLVETILKRPFFNAVKSGDLEGVKEMLAARPWLLRMETFMGNKPLHYAVASGRSDTVAVLLDAGADVNAEGDSRATPLHWAASYGHTEIAAQLLKAGADVDAIAYRHNNTPLHVAALEGHVDMTGLLLSRGANIRVPDMLDRTALQLAEERNHTDVVTLLKNQLSSGP